MGEIAWNQQRESSLTDRLFALLNASNFPGYYGRNKTIKENDVLTKQWKKSSPEALLLDKGSSKDFLVEAGGVELLRS